MGRRKHADEQPSTWYYRAVLRLIEQAEQELDLETFRRLLRDVDEAVLQRWSDRCRREALGPYAGNRRDAESAEGAKK